LNPKELELPDAGIGNWGVPLAFFSGAIRGGTPFIFVSLGECITEKSGRINLGLEGTLVIGAMAGYGMSYVSVGHGLPQWICPWIGVLTAGLAGAIFGILHATLCQRPRVNDIAVGIGLMLFGTGLAFYLGKPLIEPSAPHLPSLHLGGWSNTPQIREALNINALFLLGCALSPLIHWGLKCTRWGMIVRTVGESAESARAMGYSVDRVRMIATAVGGFVAGIGGAFLSLYYPGGWNEGLASGQGLIAVALVIFARWNPIYCLLAALLFGGSAALGPSLQSVGVTSGKYLFGAAPYVLTLVIMIITCSPKRTWAGAPAELGAANR
jgi:simple sugar transport system permease protein